MASRYAAVHQSPKGPGDSRPTALQVIKDEDVAGKLPGKVVLITGCSSGLGVETAKALLDTGATLYLTARDISKAKTALGDIAVHERVHLLGLNLDSLADVRKCAAEFLSRSPRLDILIANAGIMACPEGRTADGFESQLGVNHLAHFLLINLLLPILLTSSTSHFNSRVIILSSIGHRASEVHFDNLNLEGAYNPWVAYGQSKTANIWTANELERRYGTKGVHAWSVQPGGVASTGLLRHASEEEKAALQKDPTLSLVFKSPEQGAATSVWAAVAEALEGQGGKYLEDCQIAKAWSSDLGQWHPGYAPHAYDADKEAKLWAESLKLVGLSAETA